MKIEMQIRIGKRVIKIYNHILSPRTNEQTIQHSYTFNSQFLQTFLLSWSVCPSVLPERIAVIVDLGMSYRFQSLQGYFFGS